MASLPEKSINAREQIDAALVKQSLASIVFEPIWYFVEQLFPPATWEHLSQLDVLLLYATLASYALSLVGIQEEKVSNALQTVPTLGGKAIQRVRQDVLAQLLEVSEVTSSKFMPIEAFLGRFSRPKTHPQLPELILLVGWLYNHIDLDRVKLEHLAAEELKETLETARSHFSRAGNIEKTIDSESGHLLVTLPEADDQGRVVSSRLTQSIGEFLEKNSDLILEFSLPYKVDLVKVECAIRERAADINFFEALLVPIRDVPPYRGLDPFTGETRHLFSGRDYEVQVFTDDMLCHRITVMRGASGIGKTSLLLAGLMTKLVTQHHFSIVVTAQYQTNQNYPLARAITEALITNAKRVLPDLDLSGLAADTNDIRATCRFLLNAFRQHMPREHPRLFIIVDQLEAFLLGSTLEWQQQFFTRVIECDLDYGLDVAFLFAIRSEFFDLLEPHKSNVIDLYSQVRRLLPLNPAAVKDTVERPARICGVEYEEGLVDEIVKDLTSTRSAVVTPQIQIVLTTLYDAAQAANSKRISRALFYQMGKCEGILSSFLNNAVEEFAPSQRNLVKRILIEMTTGTGTALTVTIAELAEICNTSEVVMKDVMDQLARRTWLIRRTDPTLKGEATFRLAHEYLITAIQAWLEPDERVLRRLRQHFSMLFRAWQESSANDLFLMTKTQLMEFQGRLAAVITTPEQVAYYTKSAMFEAEADEELWEGYALLKDQNLLANLISEGLRTLNPSVCSKAKDLLITAIESVGRHLWQTLPSLPWHARQNVIDVFIQWKGGASLAQEGLQSHDWRVYSASMRLLAAMRIQ